MSDEWPGSAFRAVIVGCVLAVVLIDPPYGIGIDGQKQSTNRNPKHNAVADSRPE